MDNIYFDIPTSTPSSIVNTLKISHSILRSDKEFYDNLRKYAVNDICETYNLYKHANEYDILMYHFVWDMDDNLSFNEKEYFCNIITSSNGCDNLNLIELLKDMVRRNNSDENITIMIEYCERRRDQLMATIKQTVINFNIPIELPNAILLKVSTGYARIEFDVNEIISHYVKVDNMLKNYSDDVSQIAGLFKMLKKHENYYNVLNDDISMYYDPACNDGYSPTYVIKNYHDDRHNNNQELMWFLDQLVLCDDAFIRRRMITSESTRERNRIKAKVDKLLVSHNIDIDNMDVDVIINVFRIIAAIQTTIDTIISYDDIYNMELTALQSFTTHDLLQIDDMLNIVDTYHTWLTNFGMVCSAEYRAYNPLYRVNDTSNKDTLKLLENITKCDEWDDRRQIIECDYNYRCGIIYDIVNESLKTYNINVTQIRPEISNKIIHFYAIIRRQMEDIIKYNDKYTKFIDRLSFAIANIRDIKYSTEYYVLQSRTFAVEYKAHFSQLNEIIKEFYKFLYQYNVKNNIHSIDDGVFHPRHVVNTIVLLHTNPKLQQFLHKFASCDVETTRIEMIHFVCSERIIEITKLIFCDEFDGEEIEQCLSNNFVPLSYERMVGCIYKCGSIMSMEDYISNVEAALEFPSNIAGIHNEDCRSYATFVIQNKYNDDKHHDDDSTSRPTNNSNNNCCVCMTEPVTMLLTQCGHAVLCSFCFLHLHRQNVLEQTRMRCPKCREIVQTTSLCDKTTGVNRKRKRLSAAVRINRFEIHNASCRQQRCTTCDSIIDIPSRMCRSQWCKHPKVICAKCSEKDAKHNAETCSSCNVDNSVIRVYR